MTDNTKKFTKRENENTDEAFERKGRFFCKNGEWFFKTRDETNYGPFDDRTSCRYAYDEFMEVVSESNVLAAESEEYDLWQPPKINFS